MEKIEEKLNDIHRMLTRLTDVHLTRQELADKFQVDPVTIDNYRKKGLKRLKNGRYPLNESIEWLHNHKNQK